MDHTRDITLHFTLDVEIDLFLFVNKYKWQMVKHRVYYAGKQFETKDHLTKEEHEMLQCMQAR